MQISSVLQGASGTSVRMRTGAWVQKARQAQRGRCLRVCGPCRPDCASPCKSGVCRGRARATLCLDATVGRNSRAGRRLLTRAATAKPALGVACVEGSRVPSARHWSMLPRSLPGLPPPAVIPNAPEGREPAVACLRGMVKVGTNTLRWEFFQLLLLL